jgi:NAD-dependent deacetylase
MSDRADAADLGRAIAAAGRVCLFSGAGISTGSGIPDFRGPQGVWKRRRPVYFQDFVASEAARIEYWDGKAEGWEGFRDAAPNAAHRAVVALERAGRLGRVVTQNIDGLHQAAGSSPERVIELHGTNREIECIACGERTPPDPAVARFRAERACPKCACGGWLKFATISFGRALDEGVLDAAFAAAAACDLMIAVGSTLEVQPAAQIPLGRPRGARYAIVNRGETAHDAICDLRLEGDVVELLPRAVAEGIGG